MKKSKILFLLAFFVFPVFSQVVAAQNNKKAEIRQIDAYCKTIDAFAKRNKNSQTVFADASASYEKDAKSDWRKFASEKAFEKARAASEFYDIAYVWRKSGKVVLANFTLSSPSGDWAQYVFHYFRPDGTLAKVESDLRTFYGELIVEQEIYFNRRGAILKTNRKYLDLQTRKPKNPGKDRDESLKAVEYYKQTAKLPFAALLKNK